MKKLILFTITTLIFANSLLADTLVATGTAIKIVDSAGNISNFLTANATGLAFDNVTEKLYFSTTENSIKRVDRDGTNLTTIIANVGSAIGVLDIDTVNNKLIWTQPDIISIKSADLDGTDITILSAGLHDISGMYVDNESESIFFNWSGGITKCDLDGTNVTAVHYDGPGGMHGLTVFEGKLYWANADNNAIRRANIDGSSLETLVTGANAASTRDIEYDIATGKLFYVTAGAAKMRKINADGSGGTQLADLTGRSILTGFSTTAKIPNPRMYVATFNTADSKAKVFWTTISGESVDVLDDTDIVSVHGMSYSNLKNKLYLVDNISSTVCRIKRSNPDGSSVEAVTNITGQCNNILVDDENSRLLVTFTNANIYKLLEIDINTPATQNTIITLGAGERYLKGLDLTTGNSLVNGIRYTSGFVRSSIYKTNLNDITNSLHMLTTVRELSALGAFDNDKYLINTDNRLHVAQITGSGTAITGFGYNILPSTSNIIAYASHQIDPQKFSTNQVIFAGQDNKLLAIFPANNPTLSTIKTLASTESVTALTDVQLPAVFPNPVPTPTPDDKGNYNLTIETSDVFRESELEALLALLRSYFDNSRSSRSDEFDTSLKAYLAKPNAQGQIIFPDVPPGTYTLSYQRDDASFSSESVTFTLGEVQPTVYGNIRDLSDFKCTAKNKINKIYSSHNKARKIAMFALKVAEAVYDNSSNKAKLITLADKLKDEHANLVDKISDLPKFQLVCRKQTTCTKKSFKPKVKNYRKTMGKVFKAARNLIKASANGNSRAAKLAKLDKLINAATLANTKLVKKSFDCPFNAEVDDGLFE